MRAWPERVYIVHTGGGSGGWFGWAVLGLIVLGIIVFCVVVAVKVSAGRRRQRAFDRAQGYQPPGGYGPGRPPNPPGHSTGYPPPPPHQGP
jgi:hypothetical protein